MCSPVQAATGDGPRESVMMPPRSFRCQLEVELGQIEAGVLDLWADVGIKEFRNDPSSILVRIGAPQYSWHRLPLERRGTQARLMAQYKRWYELFDCCHRYHSQEVRRAIEQTHEYVCHAIELDT